MIKLYYTVASTQDATQTKPQLSLGGYRSSTLVENSKLNNAFGDISLLTIKQYNQNQYIGLVMKNETADITGAKIWVTKPSGAYSDFKLSVVSMTVGSDGFKQMEQITTINSKPLLSDFQTYGADNKFDIGDMVVGDVYGLWIERVIDVETAAADQQDVYEVDPSNSNKYIEKAKSTEDEFIINISWD